MVMLQSARLPSIRMANASVGRLGLHAQSRIAYTSLGIDIRKAKKKSPRLLGRVWSILRVPIPAVRISIRLLDI